MKDHKVCGSDSQTAGVWDGEFTGSKVKSMIWGSGSGISDHGVGEGIDNEGRGGYNMTKELSEELV